MWVCQEPEDNRFALIGKAHHCMVDGLAAVELGSLLLDVTPEAQEPPADPWNPEPEPGGERLLVRGVRDLLATEAAVLRAPVRIATSPARAARSVAGGAARVTRAVGHSLLAGAPSSALNRSLSPLRRLAWAERPLEDLSRIKQAYGTTINDVMLAAVAGGMRTYLAEHGEEPVALKAMVPVSVRSSDDVLGNHISFVFAELPCDLPDPLGRLFRVHDDDELPQAPPRARGRGPGTEGGPTRPGDRPERGLAGDREPPHLQPRGVEHPRTTGADVHARLPAQSVYPVVPLSDRHRVSIGMTTVYRRACFGVYADREALPDAHMLAHDIDVAISELLACT